MTNITQTTATNAKNTPTKNYYKGLDGLRCLAIFLVILYHYIPYKIPAGFLGVDIFLVLSGYLTTMSVMKQIKQQHFSYPKYLYKRLIRLTVPLLGMFFFSVPLLWMFGSKFIFNIRQTIISSLCYFNNWAQLAAGSSYFEAFVNPSPYTHLWYLSVQMQLYLLLPLILIVLLKITHSKEKTAYGVLSIALISSVLMACLFKIGGDPSRVYYGTDTRAFSFLMGGFLLLYQEKLSYLLTKLYKSYAFSRYVLMGGIGLLFIGMPFWLTDVSAFTYRGGILLYDVVVMGLIYSIIHNNLLNKLFSFVPLRFFGKISYSMYLWYFPIYSYFTYGPYPNSFIAQHWKVQLILLIVIACCHYYCFEIKLAKNILQLHSSAYRTIFKNITNINWLKQLKLSTKIMSGILVILTSMNIVALATAPSGENKTVAKLQAELAENQRKIAEQRQAELQREKEQIEQAQQDIPNVAGLDRQVMLYAHSLPVTFIGDSILLSSAKPLVQVFPKSIVEGEVGRQLYDQAPFITSLKEQNKLNDICVIVLGTNGPFKAKHLEAFVNAFGGEHKLVFVNTLVPRPWQDQVNANLQHYTTTADQTYLINWHDYSMNHPEWFREDNVHLNTEGAQAFSNYIATQLYELFGK